MRDIKHIISDRNSCSFTRWRRNRTGRNLYRKFSAPARRRRYRSFLLPIFLLVVLVGSYPLLSPLLRTKHAGSATLQAEPEPPRTLPPLDPYQSFQLAVDRFPESGPAGTGFSAPSGDGGKISYAVDPELQARVMQVMQRYQVPYGAFVAIEPRSGKVLALAGHSSADPAWSHRSCFSPYPMASLFKIITAAAALEENKVSPDTVFAYRGGTTSENPATWSVKAGRNSEISLTAAMGKSVNPVFGRLASDVAGKAAIMSCVERFGFNQTLFPGSCFQPSRALPPQDDLDLKLMGAGLGREVKISPFHAALMMAAIANGGEMMVPSLAEEITNGRGEIVYRPQPAPARRIISRNTAENLSRMLSSTVNSGTSRKAFHDRRGRPMLGSLDIAAKTGSIDGKDPDGHYSWFAAYAPIRDPQIALVALVVNAPKWKIKASHLGEQALESFFR